MAPLPQARWRVSHMSTLHHELDQVYLQSATGADGMDRWIFSSIAMGSGFAGGGVAKDFSLSLPGALSTGDLTIRLYSPYDDGARDRGVAKRQ